MAINPENLIKARTSETIVEELFRSAGYHVFRFGYKYLLQNFVVTNEIDFKSGKILSRMPDLLIATEDKHFFVEVKYRKDGKISPSDVRTWTDAGILLVFPFPPYFRIAQIEQFLQTKKLPSLVKNEFIPVRGDVIERYVPLIKKYFMEKNEEKKNLRTYSPELK